MKGEYVYATNDCFISMLPTSRENLIEEQLRERLRERWRERERVSKREKARKRDGKGERRSTRSFDESRPSETINITMISSLAHL